MEPLPASADTPPWWHSRRNRKRVLLPVELALIGLFAWQWFGFDPPRTRELLVLWLAMLTLSAAEWLWFYLLDPNFSQDDSLPRSVRSFRPREGQRWWQSRFRRQQVLRKVSLASCMTLAILMNRPQICLVGLFAHYPIDWMWFRYFDPDYPEHDLDIDPVAGIDIDKGFAGLLFWFIGVGLALVMVVVVMALLWR